MSITKISHRINNILHDTDEFSWFMSVNNISLSSFMAEVSCSTSGSETRPNSLALLRTPCSASLAEDKLARESFFLDTSLKLHILLQAKNRVVKFETLPDKEK